MPVSRLIVGDLRHQVAIRRNSPSADGAGGYSDSWSTVATVWGSVEPLRGAERLRAMQVDATTTHKVVIRYNSTPNQEDQLVIGSIPYRITSLLNVDLTNRVIEILATQVARGVT